MTRKIFNVEDLDQLRPSRLWTRDEKLEQAVEIYNKVRRPEPDSIAVLGGNPAFFDQIKRMNFKQRVHHVQLAESLNGYTGYYIMCPYPTRSEKHLLSCALVRNLTELEL